MARRKSAAQKEREYRYAQAAENYRRRTDIPQRAYSGRQPRKEYAYRPLFFRTGTNLDGVPALKLRASELAVTRIGQARLNISDADANLNIAISPPTAFEPSMIRIVANRSGDPTSVVAYGGTGRPYRKYAADSSRTAKAHANAPICVSFTDQTPTLQELMLSIRAVISDKATILGANGGSISYSIESLREIEF